MDNQLKESIGQSMDANEVILPYLPELVKDLWAMGGSSDHILEMIKPLNLPSEETRVLDLGCGKGAISIALAKKYSFRITGIDGCQAFVDEAEKKSIQYNVPHLCQFERADIRTIVKSAKNFDIVILASLGNVLGTFQETMQQLRQTVRTKGYVIIDDGFLKQNPRPDKKGYEHYLTHDETIEQLTFYGDQLVCERVLSAAENQAINDLYLHVIKQRGKDIIKRQSELRNIINQYIEDQKSHCEIIAQFIAGSIWLLQKN